MKKVEDTSQYLSAILEQAFNAQMNFTKYPSASTAIEYAQSCGHHLDDHAKGSNSIDTYPLMIFINHDRAIYMIYSDIIKDWLNIGYDGEDRIIHDLDTFGSYGKAGVFQFVSDGSSFLFDATFKAPVITDTGEDNFQSSRKYDLGQYVPKLGISIFH